ncbi:TraB/GumN family protein [Balneatrix alpica]|uniref:TraB/GumN family protein n=1 Tax=Balneatrix alpica TaxID=75684 RepID=A0ABV5ZBA8_9GAMM|nr:TraB/GumN family protein [Balneatrix alpica]
MTKRPARPGQWLALLLLTLLWIPQLWAGPVYAWQVRSPTATLYLLGSLHAFRPQDYPLPAPIEAAFALADALVVEIDPTAMSIPEQQALIERYSRLAGDKHLNHYLSPTLRQALQRHCQRLAVACDSMQHWQPWRLGSHLVLADAARQGFQTDSGIDHYFMRRSGNRPILALETLEGQLQSLAVDDIALQVRALQSSLEQMDSQPEFLQQLYLAWRRGDAEQVYLLLQQESAQDPQLGRYMDRLNRQRNQQMSQRLLSLLQSRGTFFVVVGALHLPGPEGILALLQQAQYPARQLQEP